MNVKDDPRVPLKPEGPINSATREMMAYRAAIRQLKAELGFCLNPKLIHEEPELKMEESCESCLACYLEYLISTGKV